MDNDFNTKIAHLQKQIDEINERLEKLESKKGEEQKAPSGLSIICSR